MTSPHDSPDWYTTGQAAKLLGVSRATILRRIYADRIPAIQGSDGSHWRIPAEYVSAQLAKVGRRLPRRRVVDVSPGTG